jgi:molybdopterin molybdotransferase
MTTPSAAPADSRPLAVAEARALALEQVDPLGDIETVPLATALGRVLAADLPVPFNVPAYDHSAMDGYAFAATELGGSSPVRLAILGTVLAGHGHAGIVAAGTCVRIMTGAALPAGCDTVIPQELTTRDGDTVCFEPASVRAGVNVRLTGEDLARGAVALRAGRVLRAADLGLAASLGVAQLSVRRRIRVALLSTGDELDAPGTPPRDGARYDSNRALLTGLLAPLPVEVLDFGIVRDTPAALDSALSTAAAQADVVLTSGGVSVGDADFTRALLERLGRVHFEHLAIRPGRPFACGRLHPVAPNPRAALFFGLPGNPVAAAVTFQVIVRDALLALAGALPQPVPLLAAHTTRALAKRAGRTEYLRGHAERDAQGCWQVTPAGAQGSASLTGLSAANCLIVLQPDTEQVAAQASVDILPLDGLL